MIQLLQLELGDLDKGALACKLLFYWLVLIKGLDIRNDQNYLDDCNSQMANLRAKKTDLTKAIKENQEWMDNAMENREDSCSTR